MSTSAQWLERLSRATDYADLQAMFQELLADLHDGEDNGALAQAIDDAIRRMHIERARDAHELESFEQEFATFREQQQGVVGWFRRHLPFSHTRRQERGHRESIADQQAEILADNLIIARAQMVKEQLLPPEQRKMGRTVDQWRARLGELRADASLQPFAIEMQGLIDEIQRSQEFLGLLEQDVQAFANADFTAAEDERRQRTDLEAARSELAALQGELEHELALKSAGLRRLGELVSDDLTAGDDTYRRGYQRSLAMGRAREQAVGVQNAADQLLAQLQRIVELEGEQLDLPRLFQQMEQEATRFRQQADEARQRQHQLSRQIDQRSSEFDAVNLGVQQARSAFDAARRLFEAYTREQGVVELDPQTKSSPVFGEFQRQESALHQAESLFQQVATPFQQMQVEVIDLGRLAETLIRNVEEVLRRQQGNTRRQREVQDALAGEYHKTRPLFARLENQLRSYTDSLAALGRNTRLPDLSEFQDLGANARNQHSANWLPNPDWARRRQASAARDDFELIRRFREALRGELEQLERDFTAEKEALKVTWSARVRELLNENLAEAVIGLA